MKMKARQFLFIFFACLFVSISQAQLKFPSLGNPDIRIALEKVISDFPKEFANLKGDVLNDNPQTVEYNSLLTFKSAEQNTIIQHSGKHNVYSWQAQMFTSEEFEQAENKYRTLYNQLKSISLTLNRDYIYGLSGEYGAADERKKFSSTIFQLSPNASNLPKVKVELSLQYELMEWKIYLLVYQKEREANERGNITE